MRTVSGCVSLIEWRTRIRRKTATRFQSFDFERKLCESRIGQDRRTFSTRHQTALVNLWQIKELSLRPEIFSSNRQQFCHLCIDYSQTICQWIAAWWNLTHSFNGNVHIALQRNLSIYFMFEMDIPTKPKIVDGIFVCPVQYPNYVF